MAYKDYLPTQALIGIPRIKYIGVYFSPINQPKRLVFDCISKFEKAVTPTYSDVIDRSKEYAKGITVNTGDIVKVTEIGLKYKYAGVDALVINDDNFNSAHPSIFNEKGERVNGNLWTPMGYIDQYVPRDMATSTRYTFASGGLPKLRITFDTIATYDDAMGVALFGITAGYATVYLYDLSDVLLDSFDIDTFNSNRIFIVVPTAAKKVEVVLGGKPKDGYRSGVVEVSAACVCDITYLGSQLIGHTSNRVSEYRAYLSDGIEKIETTKSYDKFSGHLLVDSSSLKKTEYALSEATQSDYIFHTGTGYELYDQRVYLGRINYSSPIEDNSNKYKIKVDGQSLSYKIKESPIQPDSTDGYPQ